jgi:hypothetical protein
VLARKSIRAHRIACGHRGDHDIGILCGRFDKSRWCDACSTQDANPQRYFYGFGHGTDINADGLIRNGVGPRRDRIELTNRA